MFWDVPKNPSKNRKTSKPAKLSTSEVGTQRMTKTAKEIVYGMLRPTAGILLFDQLGRNATTMVDNEPG
jgi:hypothetical protein